MQKAKSTLRTVVAGLMMLAGPLAIVGCATPSLLISLVSGKRNLVEVQLIRESLFAIDKIALIEVSGLITNSPGSHLLTEGEHPVSLLLEQLDKARRDRSVKAVILRINSPGGTVVASELMHDEIARFRRSGKPVIAVLMDVATSGGYYIACACDEIVAQPSTVTGSIGVIMQLFDISGTLKKVGVRTDAIVSGAHKDSGSPFRKMSDEERRLFQTIVDEMHGRFVDIVAAGRPKLDERAVEALADGRVYTATQALELGLIDRIAGMGKTVEAAKKRVGASSIRLVAYKRPAGYKPNYYARAPHGPGGDVNLFNINLPPWLTSPTPRFMYLWDPGH